MPTYVGYIAVHILYMGACIVERVQCVQHQTTVQVFAYKQKKENKKTHTNWLLKDVKA